MPVNEYFLDHPEMVLGRMGAVHGAYRADDLVVRATGDTIAALSAALMALTDRRPAPRPDLRTCRPRHGGPLLRQLRHPARRRSPTGTCAPGRTARSPRSSTAPSSRMRCPRSQAAELRQLLALRDSARALLAAEAASAEDTPEHRAACAPSWAAATTATSPPTGR